MTGKLSRPLLLVGCGKMGAAMLQGWLQRDLKPADVYIVEPNAEAGKAIAAKYGVNAVIDAGGLPDGIAPETIVLAVKPQSMDAALPAYARYVRPECLFLSIAAGKTIAYFERYLGDQAAIVRAWRSISSNSSEKTSNERGRSGMAVSTSRANEA